jgi:glycosyltransferase involved in cell wall biosynthesis
MKALVVTPTYGRIQYLPRMLASFISQTWEDKHLVIINDDKNIILRCSYPNVSVVNLKDKLLIPQKRNIGNSLIDCDIIFPYDDDDILLPDHISNHMKQYELYDIMGYRNNAAYVIYNNKFTRAASPTTDISYKKILWESVKGYRAEYNIGEDIHFFESLHDVKIVNNPEESDYVYVWSGVNYHGTYALDNDVDKVAHEYLKTHDLIGKEYWIEPDFEEYHRFISIRDHFEAFSKPVEVEIVDNGKIRTTMKHV